MREIYSDERKRLAHDRAEAIRGGMAELGVLYARARAEEDWKVLGYASEKRWAMDEFGADRLSPERRKEWHAVLTKNGWTQRQIAEATGSSQSTVKRDQREAGESNDSPASPRQTAAREREERRRASRPSYSQDEIDRAVMAGLARGKTHAQIAKELGIARRSNPFTLAVQRATMGSPRRAARERNWNGTTNPGRQRELKDRQRSEAEAYQYMTKVQQRISELSSVLEGVNLEDIYRYGDDEVWLWHISDLLEDLISLDLWNKKFTTAIGTWLKGSGKRELIAKLRDTAGRTPEEIALFNAKADQIERQMALTGTNGHGG